ncbi:hypothetical protein N752_03940 [Desulforamulus aquiferis]|nr:histidine kinase dimerization/phospho-acceptor domain-containing protein [Desulforamulus aquiferis]RYD06487.1 hypothetical protein N752_03940 [Desulforamulus aquiferis]
MGKLAPVDQLKDIYWVAHLFFFIIITVLGILDDEMIAQVGLFPFEHAFTFAFVFCFFAIINSIFLKAIKEKFSDNGRMNYQILYSMSLTFFTIIFIIFISDKIGNWIYVIPITLVSLTCGFRLGLASTLFLGIHMMYLDGDITNHNLPVFLCFLLIAWLVGQISEINYRQALQLESERRFLADLIETFSGGIVVSNSDGEVILCNREIKNVFHREKADIIGKGESLLWVNSSIPFHKWQSNFINMELSIGSREYLVSRFSIAGIEPGKKCYVTVLNDITEVQMQREKLHNLTTLSALGELAAGAAHEIKNPLTTIRGFLQLLRDKNGSHQLNELYALSIEELDRINYIVNSMLQLAKPDMDEPKNSAFQIL